MTLLVIASGVSASAAPFADPPEFPVAAGVSQGKLVAAEGPISVASERIDSIAYNGVFMPPVIRVPPGGEIDLTLTNALSDQVTNIHFHGMTVSPLADSDNIFRRVEPGETAHYRVKVPDTHQRGLFWYHSHGFDAAQRQVAGGMSGAIVVEGLLDPFPALRGIRERVMMLKNIRSRFGSLPDLTITDQPSIRTINGQVRPVIDIRPGELQLWRFGAIGPNQYYRLRLPGHAFHVIARDGNLAAALETVEELIVTPASRVEVLVRGGEPGTYQLEMMDVTTGPVGDQYSGETLASVTVSGNPVSGPPLPTVFPPQRDLRKEAITARRDIVFSEDDRYFYVNGRKFYAERVDTVVPLGSIEEWTVSNPTEELHAFHIHQMDFQVTAINGKPVPFYGHRDTVSIPIRGEVTMIMPFDDPVMLGRFVYHCHIMEHEVGGMMAAIEVVPPEAYEMAVLLKDQGGFYGPENICAPGKK